MTSSGFDLWRVNSKGRGLLDSCCTGWSLPRGVAVDDLVRRLAVNAKEGDEKG